MVATLLPQEVPPMLVDILQDRYESIEFLEVDNSISFDYIEGAVFVQTEDGTYHVTDEAFEALLNLVRIPTKYIERCIEFSSGVNLAFDNINFWIKQKPKFSLLLENEKVTQIFDGNRLYMPGVKVNDIIVDMVPDVKIIDYAISGDLFHAIYVSQQVQQFGDLKFQAGIRALYSDCFNITPRFDGVLYDPVTQAMFCWPIQGRKFRAASTTLSQVTELVTEFVELALDQMREKLLPAVSNLGGYISEIDAEDFIKRLCSELRFNRKQQAELLGILPASSMPYKDLLLLLTSYSNANNGGLISLADAREIQVAVSHYIVEGSFKNA